MWNDLWMGVKPFRVRTSSVMFIFWTKFSAKSIRYKRILHVSHKNKPYFKIIISLLCLEFFSTKVNRSKGSWVIYIYASFRFLIYIPEVWVQLLRNLKPFRLVDLGVLELQPSWNLSWEENIFSVLVHFSPARLEPCSASPPRPWTRR